MRTLLKKFSLSFIFVFTLMSTQISPAWAQEKWVTIDQNWKLWSESFGKSSKPAVVLIMGAGAGGLQWGESFCEQLAQLGYYVIRFDHRDTGYSDKHNFDDFPYTLDDMQGDVLAIMKAHDINKAHVVGFSMGGYISQLLAINYPEQVLTFTSIASTPDHSILMNTWEGKPVRRTELEPPTQEILQASSELLGKAPTSGEEKVEQMLKFVQLLTGDKVKIDKEFWTQVFKDSIDREKVLALSPNHVLAQKSDMCDRRTQLNLVTAPGLAIQGMQDPYFPKNHGIKTAQAIPNGHYVEIEEMGHAIDPAFWSALLSELDKHFKRVT